MAIRKNKKRIDPRYFLHETTYRDLEDQPETRLNEAQGREALGLGQAQGRLMPYLVGHGWDPGQARPLEALRGYNLGEIDLADAVRDWAREVSDWSAHQPGCLTSGGKTSEKMAQYAKANPDRGQAFEYLKGIVQLFDQFSAEQAKVLQADGDVGSFNAEFEKKYGSQIQQATKKLPQLFKPSKGTANRAQAAKKFGRQYDAAAKHNAPPKAQTRSRFEESMKENVGGGTDASQKAKGYVSRDARDFSRKEWEKLHSGE